MQLQITEANSRFFFFNYQKRSALSLLKTDNQLITLKTQVWEVTLSGLLERVLVGTLAT